MNEDNMMDDFFVVSEIYFPWRNRINEKIIEWEKFLMTNYPKAIDVTVRDIINKHRAEKSGKNYKN